MPKSPKAPMKKDKPKKSRKLSEYNKFVRDEMKTFSPSVKASNRMSEIAKRWREQKDKK